MKKASLIMAVILAASLFAPYTLPALGLKDANTFKEVSALGSGALALALTSDIASYDMQLVPPDSRFWALSGVVEQRSPEELGEIVEDLFTPNVKLSVELGRSYEHEPAIAVNPLDPANVVVAAHHEDDGPLSVVIGVYYSMDGGETWNGPILMPPAEEEDFFQSDPALAAGPSGAFYLAYLSVGPRFSDNVRLFFSDSLVVARSLDGGVSWEIVLELDPFYIDFQELSSRGIFVSSVLLDKEYIAAGPGPSGDIVVVSYTEFASGFDSNVGSYFTRIRIMAVISLDGGETWKGPVQVSDEVYIYEGPGEVSAERVLQGSNPAVAPDGTIYIAYYDSGDDGWLTGTARIVVVKSVDGGDTWSEPVEAAVIEEEMDYFSPARFRAWASMFPIIDVGPDGTVYIVYGSADPETGDPGDIYLVYSMDGGDTWSEPIRINNDAPGAYQFFPWLDVDENGIAHIIWGDTRFDEDNFGFDVFYARFTPEEGASANYRVTDYTGNGFLAFFLGDYFNVAAAGGQVYVVWTDVREAIDERGGFFFIFADSSIYFAKLGERPPPVLEASVNELAAGRAAVVEIEGSGMPVNAVFLIALNGVVLDGASFVFSDSEGRIEAKVILPPLAEGVYEISLVDVTVQRPYASARLSVSDVVGAAALEAREASEIAVEAVQRALERVEAVEASIEGLARTVEEVAQSVESVREEVVSQGESTREAISVASEQLREELRGAIEATGEEVKSAVEASREAIIEEVKREGESIREEVRKVGDEQKALLEQVLSSLEEVKANAERAIEAAASASSRSALAGAGALLAFIAAAVSAFLASRAAR